MRNARVAADPLHMGTKPLVLIADDDADILSLVRLRLERSGYAVISAQDGTEALALAASRHPDIAIFDVSMPGMSGFDVTRRLRETDTTTPVILLTARALEADVEAGAAAGANAYLTKPFSPQDLESRVRALTSGD
ncbi:MAG: two-component system, OmpR family, response regulator [Gaiellaceae bacterium]|jgi:DNA-binding response OmpR family regulator|nr:two-component system, OmpR family, response regulator [Gaiellaceae bacterium]